MRRLLHKNTQNCLCWSSGAFSIISVMRLLKFRCWYSCTSKLGDEFSVGLYMETVWHAGRHSWFEPESTVDHRSQFLNETMPYGRFRNGMCNISFVELRISELYYITACSEVATKWFLHMIARCMRTHGTEWDWGWTDLWGRRRWQRTREMSRQCKYWNFVRWAALWPMGLV